MPPLTEPIGEILGVEDVRVVGAEAGGEEDHRGEGAGGADAVSDALAKQDAAAAKATAAKAAAAQAPAKKAAKAPAKKAVAKQAPAKQAPPVKKSAKKAPGRSPVARRDRTRGQAFRPPHEEIAATRSEVAPEEERQWARGEYDDMTKRTPGPGRVGRRAGRARANRRCVRAPAGRAGGRVRCRAAGVAGDARQHRRQLTARGSDPGWRAASDSTPSWSAGASPGPASRRRSWSRRAGSRSAARSRPRSPRWSTRPIRCWYAAGDPGPSTSPAAGTSSPAR